jgi:hypothetical protein
VCAAETFNVRYHSGILIQKHPASGYPHVRCSYKYTAPLHFLDKGGAQCTAGQNRLPRPAYTLSNSTRMAWLSARRVTYSQQAVISVGPSRLHRLQQSATKAVISHLELSDPHALTALFLHCRCTAICQRSLLPSDDSYSIHVLHLPTK